MRRRQPAYNLISDLTAGVEGNSRPREHPLHRFPLHSQRLQNYTYCVAPFGALDRLRSFYDGRDHWNRWVRAREEIRPHPVLDYWIAVAAIGVEYTIRRKSLG